MFIVSHNNLLIINGLQIVYSEPNEKFLIVVDDVDLMTLLFAMALEAIIIRFTSRFVNFAFGIRRSLLHHEQV